MNQKEFEKWFKNSKVVDETGQPIVLWHGSRTNTLTEFKKEYEGTGVVTIQKEEYGGFFFASVKDAAEYYTYGGTPEEPIDIKKGEILVQVYGEKNEYYYILNQRDDISYNKKYKKLLEEYKKENGEDADEYEMEVDIEDEFEDIANGGPYKTWEEAEEAGEEYLNTHQECYEKQINPYLYPIHLNLKNPYIHDTNKDGFKAPREVIKIAKESDEEYDGIIVIDVYDGDQHTDVYVAFDVSSIHILDKMNPENCRYIINKEKKKNKKKKMRTMG